MELGRWPTELAGSRGRQAVMGSVVHGVLVGNGGGSVAVRHGVRGGTGDEVRGGGTLRRREKGGGSLVRHGELLPALAPLFCSSRCWCLCPLFLRPGASSGKTGSARRGDILVVGGGGARSWWWWAAAQDPGGWRRRAPLGFWMREREGWRSAGCRPRCGCGQAGAGGGWIGAAVRGVR